MSQWDIRLPSIRPNRNRYGLSHPTLVEHYRDFLNRPTVWVPMPVTTESPLPERRAVWKLATYFRQEGHYDFTQYGYEGHEDDDQCVAWLWKNHDVYYGAAAFRWRDWTNAPHGWGLQWVWLHPYFRGQGELTKVWPMWKAMFGAFYVEPPLSHGMKAFLSKVGHKNHAELAAISSQTAPDLTTPNILGTGSA